MSLTLEPKRKDVHSVTSQRFPRQVFATMKVEAHHMRFQLDTGATCNVLCKKDVPSRVQISSTTQTLTMYNRDVIKPLGKCRVRVVNPKMGQHMTKILLLLVMRQRQSWVSLLHSAWV